MKIVDALISSLRKDSTVQEVYSCAHFTAVLSRNCGLATTFREEHPHHTVVREVGNLRGGSALELARYANSDNLLESSIGMATINSLIDIDEAECIAQNAFDILAGKAKDKKVVIVGHFPWIPALQRIAKQLSVLEQRPQLEDLPAEAAEEVLPEADVVGITATSLINHTLEKLLELSRGKFIVMIGPTSPLSPVLFDYGIDAVCGVKVVEPQKAVRTITEGATYPQIEGIRKLCLLREGR